jgi:cardiolipin synthase
MRSKQHPVLFALFFLLLGFGIAIGLAMARNPPAAQLRLAHRFAVSDPTFLSSSLDGAALTAGNRIDVLRNGREIFPEMLAAIASAKKTIDFEAYIFWSGSVASRFRDALGERSRQGVEVRILLDAFGTPRRKIHPEDIDELRRAGCHVEFFHPARLGMLWAINHRTHRRILVVDGKIGFTGGVGFADEWEGDADSPKHWRETQARLEGPVVRSLQAAFDQNWCETTGEPLLGNGFFPPLPPAGTATAAVVSSSFLAAESASRRLYAVALSSATRRVWLSSSYFLPDEDAAALLVAAVARGVDVQVIVPGDKVTDVPATKAAGRGSYGPLLRGGVRIFEYQGTMFHPKTMVVDGLFATIGSANFDDRSFHLNEEVNVAVADSEVARRMEGIFVEDRRRCRPYTYEDWKRRTLWKRMTEWLSRPFRAEL